MLDSELVKICTKCGMYKNCDGFTPKQTILSNRGTLEKGKILLVGSFPSIRDVEEGMVFSGEIGQALKSFLLESDIDPRECNYTNAIKCCPGENKEPELQNLKFCRSWLISHIENLQPKVIISFGAFALKSLTGKSGIKNYRGNVLSVKGLPQYPVVPTFNVGFVFRYPQQKEYIISDLKLAVKVHAGTHLNIPAYNYVVDDESFQSFEEYLHESKEYAVDIETATKSPWDKEAKILSIAFCNEPKVAWTVLLDHKENTMPFELKERVKNLIRNFLLQEEITKIFHNNMFDVLYLQMMGYEIRGNIEDTMFQAYLGVSEEELSGLKPLAMRFTDLGNYEKEVDDFFEVRKIKKKDRKYEKLPIAMLLKYNACDTDATFRLKKLFSPLITKYKLQKTYDFLLEASKCLMSVRKNGAVLNESVANFYGESILAQISEIEGCLDSTEEVSKAKKIVCESYFLKGKKAPKWTYGSMNALRTLYFDVLKKDVLKLTDKGEKKRKRPKKGEKLPELTIADREYAALDENVLRTYSSFGCPISDKLIQYRKLSTEYSKYNFESILGWVHGDGLVHPSILLTRTVTGRPSAKDPNIQQFPKDNKAKKLITSRFGSNGVIFEQDYGQNELRGLCFYSRSVNMMTSFQKGLDVHSVGASIMFDYSWDDWCTLQKVDEKKFKELRTIYKTIVFGLVYGRGPQSMAVDLWIAAGCPAGGSSLFVPLAKEKLEKFFAVKQEIEAWIDATKTRIQKRKYCRSRYGRIRRLLAVKSDDHGVVAEALRQGVNFIIQSWSSDITLISLMRFQYFLEQSKMQAFLIGSIHDAIVGDCQEKHKIDAVCALKYIMLNPPRPIDVPLVTKIEFGENWGEKEEWKDVDKIYSQWLTDGKYLDMLQEICVDTWGNPPEDEG